MRKMDEMEWKVNMEGIRWSYFFLVLSLFLWGGYNFIKTGEMSLPLVLCSVQFVVYFVTTSIVKSKITEEGSGRKQTLLLAGLLFLLLLVGSLLFLWLGN